MKNITRTSSVPYSILVVEPDAKLAAQLCEWLEEDGRKAMLTHSAAEATHLLHDVVFIGCSLNGLLVDYNLRESTGCRVLQDFQEHFPLAPVAMMIEREDISVNIWARMKGIELLRKPLVRDDIDVWVRLMQTTAPV